MWPITVNEAVYHDTEADNVIMSPGYPTTCETLRHPACSTVFTFIWFANQNYYFEWYTCEGRVVTRWGWRQRFAAATHRAAWLSIMQGGEEKGRKQKK